jgi:hypothetical protein
LGYPLTNIEDYKGGVFALPLNDFTEKNLQSYINRYEKIYLQMLLGCELEQLFIDDLDENNIPQSERFQKIFNEFCYDDDCDTILQSFGILDMLKSFIYFEYGRKISNQLSSVGGRRNVGENQEYVQDSGTPLLDNYNNGVESYQSIQHFICDNDYDYPEYNGQLIEYTSFL